MKILFIASQYPYPPRNGNDVVTYNILTHLTKRHEITLLCFEPSELAQNNDNTLVELGVRCEIIPPPATRLSAIHHLKNFFSRYPIYATLWNSNTMVQKIREITTKQSFDLVHIDSVYMGIYGKEVGNLPSVFSPHDSLTLNMKRASSLLNQRGLRRLYRSIQISKARQFERTVYSQPDMVVVVAQSDADELAPVVTAPIRVIPIGVHLDYFAPTINLDKQPSIVLSGVMSYFPNHDAALYFSREIWPTIAQTVPEVRFYIVGRQPGSELQRLAEIDERIIVTGEVDDIRPYVSRAWVYVSPLRTGSGLKIKMLESMSMGKAIVATPISCDGIDVQSDVQVMVRDTAHSFAQAVIELLNNAQRRQELGQAARKLVEAKYGWSVVTEQLERIYAEMLAEAK